MAGDDVKSQALNSSHDFYAFLGLAEGASESEIRRAYRKTAPKYHSDKVGTDEKALEQWYILQLAYEVLSDPAVREIYDNARRARAQKAARNEAYEGRRRWMKEDLERRESGVFKRKRDDAEELFEQELRRLAEDGKRRRMERDEEIRKELEKDEEETKVTAAVSSPAPKITTGDISEIDRSIALRFSSHSGTKGIDEEVLRQRFERFGPIEDVVLRDKKIKVDGEKHRQNYKTAIILFKSIVGAHAAISDFGKTSSAEPGNFGMFESVGWAGGHEPECILKPSTPMRTSPEVQPEPRHLVEDGLPKTPQPKNRLRSVPSFGSFKGTPKGTPSGLNSPALDDITMIRLKNAERRRLEEENQKARSRFGCR